MEVREDALNLLLATLNELLEPSEICLSSVFHVLSNNQIHIKAPSLSQHSTCNKQVLYEIMEKHSIDANVKWVTWASHTEGQILPEIYTMDYYAFPLHVYTVPNISISP